MVNEESRSASDRILIVAAVGRDAPMLASALSAEGLACEICSGIDVLVDEIGRGVGTIVLTEEAGRPAEMARLVEVLQQQPAWSDIPVVVLTSADRLGEPSPMTLRSLDLLGNITLLERPVRIMTLFSTVRSALRARRRQYEVRAHLAQAEAESRAKDEFLAMLGHELRNPLSAVAVAARLLDVAEAGELTGVRAREVISRQIAHLSRLVDDLLDVSRVTMGKVALTRQPIDLSESLPRYVAAATAAHTRGAHTISVSAERVWVNADQTRLEQVVSNLVINAMKYTPDGGDISVAVTGDGADAVIRVSDNGIGLSPTLLPRVFDPFVQAQQGVGRPQGGLGVGLTLVRRLVELHGGSVRAESSGPGQGSTFTVRLPSVSPPAETCVSMASAAGVASQLRILLVEDNEDSREMMRQLLTMFGHKVYEAADGESGVRAALEVRPDVAIIDVGLPGLNGLQVAGQIRLSDEGRAMALVALTGYGQPQDRAQALAAGFDAFLVKPVEPALLEKVLAEHR